MHTTRLRSKGCAQPTIIGFGLADQQRWSPIILRLLRVECRATGYGVTEPYIPASNSTAAKYRSMWRHSSDPWVLNTDSSIAYSPRQWSLFGHTSNTESRHTECRITHPPSEVASTERRSRSSPPPDTQYKIIAIYV